LDNPDNRFYLPSLFIFCAFRDRRNFITDSVQIHWAALSSRPDHRLRLPWPFDHHWQKEHRSRESNRRPRPAVLMCWPPPCTELFHLAKPQQHICRFRRAWLSGGRLEGNRRRRRFGNWFSEWLPRTQPGEHRGSMGNSACSVLIFPREPSLVTIEPP